MPLNLDVVNKRLVENLVACGVITVPEWEVAVSRAGSADCQAALNVLSRTRAHWAPAVDPSLVPVLTRYQFERIEEWLLAPEGEFPRGQLVWNDYLLLEKVASGGMGMVFKGWSKTNAHYVAIKRTLSDSTELRRRLLREAELLRQLHHENVAGFYSREAFGDSDLLVMEFVPGSTLLEVTKKRLAKKSTVPWVHVAGWAVELLGALDHFDGRNTPKVVVVHRDIKPSNVMLKPHGEGYRAVLLDLGLGRAVDSEGDLVGESLTQNFQLLGTPEYMAPEQWNGGHHAIPASDVYGLGGTLYFALTGRPPFGALSTEAANKTAAWMQMMKLHTGEPRPRLDELRPDVPLAMEELIRRMLAINPEHRGKPSELRDRFRGVLAYGGTISARPSVYRPPVPVPEAPSITASQVPAFNEHAAPRQPPERPKPPPRRPAPPPPPSPIEPSRPLASLAVPDEVLPYAEEPAAHVEADAPPSPTTAEVAGAFFDWLGAAFGGTRQRAAGRLRSEFLRLSGAWLRAFARPLEHPGRWSLLLGVALLLGFAINWGWALVMLVVVGSFVVGALLVGD